MRRASFEAQPSFPVEASRTETSMYVDHHHHELLGLLVEGVEDYAILMLDVDGRVATWNTGAQRFKGYRSEEIIGRVLGQSRVPHACRAATDPADGMFCSALQFSLDAGDRPAEAGELAAADLCRRRSRDRGDKPKCPRPSMPRR